MIYNHMSIVMYNLYKKVINAGIIPKGIKTDAILVDNSKEELEKHFTFNSHEIGGIKFESGKSCVDHRISMNHLILSNQRLIILYSKMNMTSMNSMRILTNIIEL